MKRKVLATAFIFILILTGCNACKAEQKNVETSNIIPPHASEASERQKNIIPMSPRAFSNEDGIREYLEGKWVYDYYYRGDVLCTMDIDKDLNVALSFVNSYSDGPKGDYSGKITFDRAYAKPDEAPDLICIELMNTEEPGGDFFFLHRTIYDEKCVMSWFFAGNGNSVFNLEVPDDTENIRSTPDEIIFEKTTGEKSQEESRKNDEFYAVYWATGSDKKSIWLDDVWWTPTGEDEQAQVYPQKMTQYETDVPESVLYTIAPEEIGEVLGDDLTRGEVYFVKTDEGGKITSFISAERKKFMEESYLNPEAEALIYDIIENDVEEIREYLNAGMAILLTGETAVIEDEECYLVILGTNHEDNFVREVMYAVNTATRQVYRFDVLNDAWEPVPMG